MITKGMAYRGTVAHIVKGVGTFGQPVSHCGRWVIPGETVARLCKTCIRITGHVELPAPTGDAADMIRGCTSNHMHTDTAKFLAKRHSAFELSMYRDVLDDYAHGAENDACWIGTLMLVLDRPKLSLDTRTADLPTRKGKGGDGMVNPNSAKPARKRGCGASEKQEKLIRDLISQIREINSDAADILSTIYTDEWFEAVEWKRISPAIDALFSAKNVEQRKARENAPKVITPKAAALADGVYVLNGDYIKVKHNQAGTRQYGVMFNGEGWDYTPGITAKLTAEHRLTEDAAKAFGDLYGRCCECSRLLTDEESIRRGIGPVCAGNYGW